MDTEGRGPVAGTAADAAVAAEQTNDEPLGLQASDRILERRRHWIKIYRNINLERDRAIERETRATNNMRARE